jgi:hypothetical protein
MAETRDAALHRVLRLVAEGRLTADEAAPILDALSKASSAGDTASGSGSAQSRDQDRAGHAGHAGHPATESPTAGNRPRFARIQVMENGRRAVDLRVPVGLGVGLGRLALSKVPGLSSDQIEEVQDALASGTHGPILDVQDADGDGVRISLE